MDVVRQSLGAGCLDRIQAIGQHGGEDIDHLPVAARLAFQLAPYDETLSAIGPRTMIEGSGAASPIP